ncbi:MAG TPA: serine/threonine-protein kinase [Gemmataceae bacterium]|jgi:predicted Ser/Thr protein kinase
MSDREALGTIPGLEIREKIGSGGMGSVYKAYQIALDRPVALKTIRPEHLNERSLNLFQREARLLARCNHPNIVQMLEFHPEHPVPYFLMEYVDGLPLDLALRGHAREELTRVFREVVATVAAAHEHGVAHGDLKPANILVDRRSRPHILDFGLARLMRGETAGTPEERPSGGTPGFMDPEIWSGNPVPGPLSDVYSLGVTLYVLLTGVPPYQSIREAEAGHARLPIEHDADIPEPLQRICLKAMERRPEDRYQTAEQMVKDLERFSAGKPIFARPTRYLQELEGRIGNHITEIEMWEREGFINARERDVLVQPYRGLLGVDSPWLSELRAVLTGPLLLRVGAWCLLLSSLLWPVFYWSDLDRTDRFLGAAVPTALMAILGCRYMLVGNRRNALACMGSFVLLLLVLEVVLLAEFRWLEYPQAPSWELWGWRLHGGTAPAALQKPRPAPAVPAEMEDLEDEVDPPDRGGVHGKPRGPHHPLLPGARPPGSGEESRLRRLLRGHGEFMLSNSQIFAATLTLTVCIALLMRLLRASFFAPWLAVACLGLFSAALLLLGDKERFLGDGGSWVALHYLALAPALYLAGYVLERRAAARVGRAFYLAGLIVAFLAAVALATFATEEWFDRLWNYDDEVWNFWMMAYSVPVLLGAWLIERRGTPGQRSLPRRLYLLVPFFLLLPLNLLFHQGPTLAVIGPQPLRLYELLYLLASVVLILVGRYLQIGVFIVAALWGLAIWVFRTTFDHFDRQLSWPLAVGLAGVMLIGLGIWRSRRGEAVPEEDMRRKPPSSPGSTHPPLPETVALTQT